MRLKDFKRCVAGIYPEAFRAVLDSCHNLPEVEVAVQAFQASARELRRIEDECLKRDRDQLYQLASLEAKVAALEAAFETRRSPASPVEAVQEVWLEEVPPGFGNKIGLIKAVRTVSGIGLKEAKDLVEDVQDRSIRKLVFKGASSKAAAAHKVLSEAGGKASITNQ